MRIHADAGKSCTDARDCEGACIAQEDGSGRCQKHHAQFGCYAMLENGKATLMLGRELAALREGDAV